MNGIAINRRRNILLLVILFIIGFIFRLVIATLFPQPLIWDQEQYYGFALGMLREGLHADSVRLYGYPILILPFIYLFGENFHWPFTVFQAFVDCGTGVIIFLLGKKIFAEPKFAPWVGYVLYLFNPFTPAFVGVILTEIVAIFLLTFILYLLLQIISHWKNNLAFIIALVLGYLPQIKPSFQYFTVLILLVLIIMFWKKYKNLAKSVVIIVLYFLPYSYNIAVNIYRYQEFSLQSVDNVFIREVYISLFIGRAAPPGDYTFSWPVEVYRAWFDFSSPTTPLGRLQTSEKYKTLSLQIIKKDPISFLQSRMSKAWYIWEKHYLFPYVPSWGGKRGEIIIYTINSFLLALFLVGFIFWFKSKYVWQRPYLKKFGFLIILLILYISIAHIFSTSEERFSLPGYPVIFLFAGWGLNIISRLVLHRRIYEAVNVA